MTNGPVTKRRVRYNAIVKSITSFVLVVLLTACGSTPTSVPETPEVPVIEETRTRFNQADYEAALELMKQKKYSDAIVLLERVIRDSGRRAGPFINLGISFRELGKFDDSRKALLTATQIDSRNAIAFNELGMVYRRLGKFDKAKNAYMKSIDSKSGYSLPYRNLGILCDIYLQDLPCAIRNYKKYQSLTDSKDKKVGLWIVDLKKRTSRKFGGK